ncbi:uncharacterized protein PAC_16207 [Phialocephala subalpina]|uniref:Uncharacterized protein n=1 Tax=Phialocephala subalpina TaxID=576137 RepID=A0A1L7XN03_9HELO|nr:uncharacterized protein PAC_16207 [Phialocephala subalpina]
MAMESSSDLGNAPFSFDFRRTLQFKALDLRTSSQSPPLTTLQVPSLAMNTFKESKVTLLNELAITQSSATLLLQEVLLLSLSEQAPGTSHERSRSHRARRIYPTLPCDLIRIRQRGLDAIADNRSPCITTPAVVATTPASTEVASSTVVESSTPAVSVGSESIPTTVTAFVEKELGWAPHLNYERPRGGSETKWEVISLSGVADSEMDEEEDMAGSRWCGYGGGTNTPAPDVTDHGQQS